MCVLQVLPCEAQRARARSQERWLTLARSYDFTQRLSDFSDETKRQVDKLPKKHEHRGSGHRYFFTIREGDRIVEDDPHGTYLPNVSAALAYAEYTMCELQIKSGSNDPALMMVVQDQARQTVLFVPLFPGS